MKYLHKIANHVIKKFQCWLGFITIGPRAIVLNEKNQVLLVKHTYQAHWYLPGGGLKKGETFKAALLRELSEEIGLKTPVEPILFGVYHHTYLGVNDYPVIYIIKECSIQKTSSPEIEKMDWFDFDDLPLATSPGTKRRLKEYFTQTTPAEIW